MNALSTEAQPPRVSPATQIFELTEALGSGDAAVVILKLRAWLAYNQAKNPEISYRDGRWWTFSSLKKWCERDFKWATPRQLGTIMDKLEALKVITRRQYGATELKMSYWYSINEDVIEALIAKTKRGDACDDSVKSSSKNVEYKTALKQKQTPKIKPFNPKQQQPVPASIVVVDLPHQEPETESGEYSTKGEGHDIDALKAFMPHEQRSDKPISKVPLKVLSTLADELVCFGVTRAGARQIVRKYPESDIRYVMECARATTRLTNPPGFLVRELERGAAGVLGLREIRKDLRPLRDPSVVAWEERIRRDMERMVAEDAAEEVDRLSIRSEMLPG